MRPARPPRNPAAPAARRIERTRRSPALLLRAGARKGGDSCASRGRGLRPFRGRRALREDTSRAAPHPIATTGGIGGSWAGVGEAEAPYRDVLESRRAKKMGEASMEAWQSSQRRCLYD